jgi:hypothetical protein
MVLTDKGPFLGVDKHMSFQMLVPLETPTTGREFAWMFVAT